MPLKLTIGKPSAYVHNLVFKHRIILVVFNGADSVTEDIYHRNKFDDEH